MESRTTFIRTVEESKRLNHLSGPAIIVSASGMLSGGRVLHHLRAHGPDPKSTLVFVGYQAAGTRGAEILAGRREVKIYGSMVPIRCDVESLHGYSAHADANEIMAWLANVKRAPRRTFITHGEPDAAEALRKRIASELAWESETPMIGESVTLDASATGEAELRHPDAEAAEPADAATTEA
jgi:metallo-beta-lactamase family protein